MIYNLPRAKKKGEIWFINDRYFTDLIRITESVNFISNGTNFTSITIKIDPVGEDYIKYDNTIVCNILVTKISNGTYTIDPRWTNSAYRTITLASPATGDLLTWLQANAVKQ